MSLITTSYFINDINIPVGKLSNLSNEIARYETEFLKKLLGYELWKLVNAYNVSTSPQRIKDLVEGKEYTVSYDERDQTIKWNGLSNSDLISPIAYYVYYWVQRNNVSETTGIGEVKSVQENSVNVSPNQKINNAWHKMRELSGYYGQHCLEPSLYNFFVEYEDSYDELIFKEFGKINMFGI